MEYVLEYNEDYVSTKKSVRFSDETKRHLASALSEPRVRRMILKSSVTRGDNSSLIKKFEIFDVNDISKTTEYQIYKDELKRQRIEDLKIQGRNNFDRRDTKERDRDDYRERRDDRDDRDDYRERRDDRRDRDDYRDDRRDRDCYRDDRDDRDRREKREKRKYSSDDEDDSYDDRRKKQRSDDFSRTETRAEIIQDLLKRSEQRIKPYRKITRICYDCDIVKGEPSIYTHCNVINQKTIIEDDRYQRALELKQYSLNDHGDLLDKHGNIIMYNGKICSSCYNIGHNSLRCQASTDVFGDDIYR